ncbi:MAG: hypothetical protein HYX27_18130 [Acidobacteria bacterium]|nr:hypothetical protein [Acidobacteriota bacterium]
MTTRRAAIALFATTLPAAAGDFNKLAARWRSRISVIRSGRPTYTRLRFTFPAAGSFVIEEFAAGGQLAWIYKGMARVAARPELVVDVSIVTDSNGIAAEEGRARYQAGESYNLGAVEYVSHARGSAGAMELQKELD